MISYLNTPKIPKPAASPHSATRTWDRIRRWTACSDYTFRDQWLVAADVERVSQLFLDTSGIPTWWPQLSNVRLLDATAL